MIVNFLKYAAMPALIAVLAVACGGSGSDEPAPVEPGPTGPGPVEPTPLKLEIFTGKATVDFAACRHADGNISAAQYSNLLRTVVYEDVVYLVETGENCTSNTWTGIREISGGIVKSIINSSAEFLVGITPTAPEYPSGFHRINGSENLVLGYVAASSDNGFALDAAKVADYTERSMWLTRAAGLYKFTGDNPYASELAAGARQVPAVADGQGNAASFYAPHSLEVDASGLFHVIDQNLIRTIDAGYNVRTLDHAVLGISGTVKAIDADRAGNIHVLSQRQGPSYTWHRLADGTAVEFSIREFVITEPATFETFTVVDDTLLLAVRGTGAATSSLYRVAADGTVEELTGNTAPATPQDFLDNLAGHLLPQVQHLEYGVDGHLYIVLPQGVLRAQDFAAAQ